MDIGGAGRIFQGGEIASADALRQGVSGGLRLPTKKKDLAGAERKGEYQGMR